MTVEGSLKGTGGDARKAPGRIPRWSRTGNLAPSAETLFRGGTHDAFLGTAYLEYGISGIERTSTPNEFRRSSLFLFAIVASVSRRLRFPLEGTRTKKESRFRESTLLLGGSVENSRGFKKRGTFSAQARIPKHTSCHSVRRRECFALMPSQWR